MNKRACFLAVAATAAVAGTTQVAFAQLPSVPVPVPVPTPSLPVPVPPVPSVPSLPQLPAPSLPAPPAPVPSVPVPRAVGPAASVRAGAAAGLVGELGERAAPSAGGGGSTSGSGSSSGSGSRGERRRRERSRRRRRRRRFGERLRLDPGLGRQRRRVGPGGSTGARAGDEAPGRADRRQAAVRRERRLVRTVRRLRPCLDVAAHDGDEGARAAHRASAPPTGSRAARSPTG